MYKRQVLYWQPICEQNLLTIDRLLSPSGSLAQAFQENHHRTLAQARVFRRFHQRGYPGWIGPALNLVKVYPLTPDPEDVEAAMNMELIRNWLDLDLAVSGRYSAPVSYTHLDVYKRQLYGMDCDERLKHQLETIVEKRNLPVFRLMSGAGHDSQNFKDVCPCAMIFVRSVNGYSHRKEEYTPIEDCAAGANVLMDMLYQLANEEDRASSSPQTIL